MVLDEWETGDIIAQIQINNRGIRKGTTGDLDSIGSTEREEGVFVYNTTDDIPQIVMDQTNNARGNLHTLLGADSTVMSQTGITPLQVKDLDFIISDDPDDGINLGFSGNRIYVVAMLKRGSSGQATMRIRFDADATDRITMSTSSATYVRVKGFVDISAAGINLTRADGTCAHTLKVFLENDTGGQTASNEQLEVYGI